MGTNENRRRLLDSGRFAVTVDASWPTPPLTEPVTLELAPAPKSGTAAHTVGDELIVVDERTWWAVALNPAASAVYPVFDGTVALADLVDEFAGLYAIPVETAAADLAAMVLQLHRSGLLSLPDRDDAVRPTGTEPDGAEVGRDGLRRLRRPPEP